MFSLVFLQSPSQVKLTMTVLLRHNRLIQELHTLIASGTSLELKDVAKWARHCLACQKSKIHRHTRSPLSSFQEPSQRFDHVHLDLIGPLPPSNGYTYCLTMIDRFRNGQRPNLSKDITAETVAEAFFPLGCLALELLQFSQPTGAGSLSPRSSKFLANYLVFRSVVQLDTTLKLMG
ncbi:integrase catalytic domain-containing protein [Trichonephila clavipes]|nr:integrase catalytic domain-containing protein [Trichonephila clavipes]